jgi:hypothetical protein
MLRTALTSPSLVTVYCTCCTEAVTGFRRLENQLSLPYRVGLFRLFEGQCRKCARLGRCDPRDPTENLKGSVSSG